MLDPDAIWIADENTCVDGPKGRTVPKWLQGIAMPLYEIISTTHIPKF